MLSLRTRPWFVIPLVLLPSDGTTFRAPEAIGIEQSVATAPELAARTRGGVPYGYAVRLPL